MLTISIKATQLKPLQAEPSPAEYTSSTCESPCYNERRTTYAFHASGHPAIRSTHPTTLEITTEEHLTRRGDCIIAVNASKGLTDLPGEIRKTLSTAGGMARMTLLVGSHRFTVEGRGAVGLSLSHPRDLVVRKSGFASDRTLMVNADKAAADIPRDMVQLLRDPVQRITVEISIMTQSG